MPTLLSVKEVLRFDGAFVLSTLLPYWHRHGARGRLEVVLTSTGASWRGVLDLDTGRPCNDTPTMTWTLAQEVFASACQGKAAPAESMQLTGSADEWRQLCAASRPRPKASTAARDVASEGVAVAKARDFKIDSAGRAIKGVVLNAEGKPPAPPLEAPLAVDAGKAVAADPAAFAAANLAPVLSDAILSAPLS